jgi:sugar phosphate permease
MDDCLSMRQGRRAVLIALMLFLATLVGYLARMNISVALPFIAEDFGWTQGQLGELGGILLGVFLIGYGVSNVFVSPLVDYFGPRRGLIVTIALSSAFTFMAGALGFIYAMILISRILLGLSQGILFPSASKLVQAWFPPSCRSRVNAIHLSSGFASALLAPILLLPLIMMTSWEVMFFVVAFAGFLLLIPLWKLIRDTPEGDKPFKKSSPRKLIKDTSERIREAFKIRGILILTIAFMTVNFVWWGLSLWLPTYLQEARGFSLDEIVWAASLPYIGGLTGMTLGAWLSDRSGKRALLTTIFVIMCALTLFLVSVTHDKWEVIVVLGVLWFFLGIAPVNVYAILQSMVPGDLMSSATGIMNGLSNGMGFVGPIIIGTAVALTGNYDYGLVVMAFILLLGAIFFLSFRRLDNSVS